jgi:hypothetical protein
VFTNKADAKARLVIALFTRIEIVDGFGEQALYFSHLLPLKSVHTGEPDHFK